MMTSATNSKVGINHGPLASHIPWGEEYSPNKSTVDMIFSDDAILMTLLGRYDEENEIKEAVLTYCNRGAVSSQVQKREMVQT